MSTTKLEAPKEEDENVEGFSGSFCSVPWIARYVQRRIENKLVCGPTGNNRDISKKRSIM